MSRIVMGQYVKELAAELRAADKNPCRPPATNRMKALMLPISRNASSG
jgi:hypothetical protein